MLMSSICVGVNNLLVVMGFWYWRVNFHFPAAEYSVHHHNINKSMEIQYI